MLRVSFAALPRNKSALYSLVLTRCRKTVAETEPASDTSIEGLEDEFPSAEEIARICDKSRVPEDIRNRYIRKVYEKPVTDKEYTLKNLRSVYGEFGQRSGLNPGLCWPTEEELALKLEYEALAITPLHEMIDNIEKRKKAQANARLQKEQEVEKNIRKLAKMNEDLKAKAKKNEEAALAKKIKKKEIFDEIRDKLGYNIDVRDPRFRDMLIRCEEQLKREATEAQKKKKSEKKIEDLQKLVAETKALRKEKKEQ